MVPRHGAPAAVWWLLSQVSGCSSGDDAADSSANGSTADAPTSGMPAEASHDHCATFDNADDCEATSWADPPSYCIWRDVVTVLEGQTCDRVTHEFRCMLGFGQGAGCSPSCGVPDYGLIWWHEASPGVFEVAGGCDVVPAEPWQQCTPDLAGCECGCEVDCSRPYC